MYIYTGRMPGVGFRTFMALYKISRSGLSLQWNYGGSDRELAVTVIVGTTCLFTVTSFRRWSKQKVCKTEAVA